MAKGCKTAMLCCCLMATVTVVAQSSLAVSDSNSGHGSVDRRVEQMLHQMTIDEKLSLMVHSNPAIPRLGLKPYSWWNEALHGVARAGYATVFPMPIALAASFDTVLVNDIFQQVAAEARHKHNVAYDDGNCADYMGLSFFTPNINIVRDPRWGRGMETYGEDPFLTAMMGKACVDGLQHSRYVHFPFADDKYLSAAACVKHLAVHSGPEGLRHQFDSRVSPRDLYNTYLPAFEYVIRHTDVQEVMCAYNRLNGIPCCTNRELLVDILRNKWHFDRLLVTDCWALNDCWEPDTVILRHQTHATAEDAAVDAYGSELDLECGSGLSALRDAYAHGRIPQQKIDEHVRRILRTRLLLAADSMDVAGVRVDDTSSRRFSAKQAASATLVLLKNRHHLLPLKKDADSWKIHLTGPNATDTLMPLGNYNGTPFHTVSIHEGLQNHPRVQLVDDSHRQDADVVVYAGGLSPQLEGEELPVDIEGFYKGDRTTIELPRRQREELFALRKLGKPILLMLCTGSAIALTDVVDSVEAVMVAWFGGQEMGNAVAEAIMSEDGSDHFGRLPVTFYSSTNQIPDFSSYDMQGRTYRYMTEKPSFPFGYGLGYADIFLADDAKCERQADGSILVTGTVKSENAMMATAHNSAVVQVYKEGDGIHAPIRTLVGFAKFSVPANGSVGYSIPIEPFWLREYDESRQDFVPWEKDCPLHLSVGLSSGEVVTVSE